MERRVETHSRSKAIDAVRSIAGDLLGGAALRRVGWLRGAATASPLLIIRTQLYGRAMTPRGMARCRAGSSTRAPS